MVPMQFQSKWKQNLWKEFTSLWHLILSIYFLKFLFILLYNTVLVLPYESATGVHVFPILNPLPPSYPSHPSGSSQCTSPKHPLSCIRPRLVIRFTYDIIHVSMPFSQIIPPPQSPKDCSIHLCLFCCLAYRVIVTILLNSIYMH